ncbi:Alpha/Beta hydrolase protein [Chytridium lagenaria]|nr:Alpha/Beta hydrolase protein [Chytridium lagenaria]
MMGLVCRYHTRKKTGLPKTEKSMDASVMELLWGTLVWWLMRILHLVVLAVGVPLLIIYPMFVGLLLLDVPQRMILFLSNVNYPFGVDWDKPEVFGFSPNKAHNLKIRTRDGIHIGAWHILPSSYYRALTRSLEITHPSSKKGAFVTEDLQNQALKDRPVVLYFHGNAGNRAAPNRIETYKNFSEKLNLNVVTIDYRGFGNSEGTPSEDGLALDARAAWDWLLQRGVPPSNIILVGHSLGTGVATRLARDLSDDNLTTPPNLPAPSSSNPRTPPSPTLPLNSVSSNSSPSSNPSPTSPPSQTPPIAYPRSLRLPLPRAAPLVSVVDHPWGSGPGDSLSSCEMVVWGGVAAHRGLQDVVGMCGRKRAGVCGEVKGGQLLEGCEEEEWGWELEGRRWRSERRVVEERGDEVGVELFGPRGPTRMMLLELHHAHHNNVQAHDLTYDTIETFCNITL